MTDLPTVRLSAPAAIAAAVPHLLGRTPQHSLVVLGLHHTRLLMVLQLPLPAGDETPGAHAVAEVHAELTTAHATGCVLAGYGSADAVRRGVTAAATALSAAGIDVAGGLRVDGGRVWTLTRTGDSRGDGTPFDPGTSPAAALADGAAAHRAADAALAPITGAAQAEADAATEQAQALIDTLCAGGRDTLTGAARAVAMLHIGEDLLDEATDTYRRGQVLDTRRAALLSVLLARPQIRAAAARRLGDQPWHRHLWSDLTRRCAPHLAAGPATLLAAAALLGGDTVLAAAAARRALEAEPGDPLARTLQQLTALGVTPQDLRTALTDL